MLTPREVLQSSPIIPVLAIKDASKAVDIANALQKGGINIMEITLRTDDALEAIRRVADEVPSMLVGAGTVLNTKQFKEVQDAGAQFVISPGMTPTLLGYAQTQELALIPGVASASEIMLGLEYGYDTFKLFPSNIVGGVSALKAFQSPFANVAFCPTGGVNLSNVKEFLALENVLCVGGTWICPSELIDKNDFEAITRLCKEALALTKGASDV